MSVPAPSAAAKTSPTTASAPDLLLRLAAVAVLATLGFEMVPLPIRAQITPLAALIALLAVAASLGRLRTLPR